MKWIPYIGIWIYAILVIAFGMGSIYNPANEDAVITGRIPTDIFTVIGIITLYFAFASTKQYFNEEARETKRFDLLIISFLNIAILVIPIIFLLMFLSKTVSNWEVFRAGSKDFYQTVSVFLGVFVLFMLTFYYNFKLFLYNK